MVKFFREFDLDLSEKIGLILICIVLLIFFTAIMFKQEKISRVNVEIETRDNVYYSYKETMKISPDSLCIIFYSIIKEYDIEHCGEYTVTYLK